MSLKLKKKHGYNQLFSLQDLSLMNNKLKNGLIVQDQLNRALSEHLRAKKL